MQGAMLGHMRKDLFRDTWLLPYLDIETLAEEPSRLLNLLYYRIKHTPAEWAAFDNSQLVLAEHWGILVAEFNKHCVVMRDSNYGDVVPWNKEKAHRWEIIGFNKAQTLLIAQSSMAKMLRKIVSALLPDTTMSPSPLSIRPDWEICLIATPGRLSAFSRSSYLNQPFCSTLR